MMTYGQDQNGAQSAYRENAILAASPEELVVLLYKHLIINLKRAAKQILAEDFQGKGESLGKANDIVLELLSSLDFEQGGEISERLASLYSFFIREITAVGRTLDTARIGELVAIAEELHEAWEEAARQTGRAGKAAANGA